MTENGTSPNKSLHRTPAAAPPSPVSSQTLGARGTLRLLMLVLQGWLCLACCSLARYEGDGKAGKGLRGELELDLGSIDVSEATQRTFRMRGLSANEFAVGFRATQQPIDAAVRLTVTNSRGQPVINQEAALVAWHWAYSTVGDYFLYRGGDRTEVPTGHRDVRIERLNIAADGGWGTFFRPVPSETYELSVIVTKPAAVPTTIRVVVDCAQVNAL